MRVPIWLLALPLFSVPAAAQSAHCNAVLAALAGRIANATCTESADLTTANPATTPANNSIPTLPPFAFTPQTDRGVISPNPPNRTPITKAVPGVQIDARVAGDATGEARFLLRLPDDWNGRLVVAGASGTRSEFNGDFAWSDYVVQKGYAYASQNKGILNFFVTTPDPALAPAGVTPDLLACRAQPPGFLLANFWVHFYDNDAAKPFTEWQERIVQAAGLARDGVKARYQHYPRYTYAVGTSNGGYQVRRAIEEAPDLFDGGVDWEGTFVDPSANNILATLPPAIRNFPAYAASGFDPNGLAAQAIRAAGYPPDIVNRNAAGAVTASLWQNYYVQFWEVTQCQWQKRLDPGYATYRAGPGNYDYLSRAATTDVAENLAAFETTGKIKQPLITVAGTMDGLLPIRTQARAYAARVAASRKGNDEHRSAQYRLYEVQNGNHIETFRDTFPQLEFIQPHAQRAFNLLVAHVEGGAALPPDQCIPHGGAIAAQPSQPGQCASLFVP
jgi:3HB-oligomer hydrolase (3HBOH)